MGAGLLAAVLTVSGLASAGYKATIPVTVGTNSASAALGSARNSGDGRQYVEVISTESWAWFAFVDANGKYGGCTTTDVNRVAIARAAVQSSYLDVAWDGAGKCTNITLRHGSDFEPPVR